MDTIYDWSVFPPAEDIEYFEEYVSLIEGILSSGRPNIRIEGESAYHHIHPLCMSGKDDESNMLYLYYREHFIAHRLLSLSYPSNRSLAFAFLGMCKDGRTDTTPEEYEEAVKLFGKCQSEYMKEHCPWKGVPKTEAQLAASKYERTPEIRKKIAEGVKESFRHPTETMLNSYKTKGFATRRDLIENRVYHTRICLVCDREFIPRSSNHVICNEDCRRVAEYLKSFITYI